MLNLAKLALDTNRYGHYSDRSAIYHEWVQNS